MLQMHLQHGVFFLRPGRMIANVAYEFVCFRLKPPNLTQHFVKQSGIRVSLPGNSRSQVAKVTHFYRPASSCSRGGFGSHQIDK